MNETPLEALLKLDDYLPPEDSDFPGRDAEIARLFEIVREALPAGDDDSRYCGADFMAGTICSLRAGHDGPHDQPDVP